MFMRWLSLCFMHWPIDPAKLRHLIPPQLEIDTFEGRAWVGLVPFTMRDVSRYLPCLRKSTSRARRLCLPTATHFHECNVRTYVTLRAPEHAQSEPGSPGAGVWFFSLDAASRLAVWGARTLWNLPYYHAAMSLAHDESRCEIAYTVERKHPRRPAHLRTRWRIGPPIPGAGEPSREGELAHFLTERYSLFSVDRRGRIHRSAIHHHPWPLREATVLQLEESLVRAAGIDLDTNLARNPPIAWHADELEVNAWALERTEISKRRKSRNAEMRQVLHPVCAETFGKRCF